MFEPELTNAHSSTGEHVRTNVGYMSNTEVEQSHNNSSIDNIELNDEDDSSCGGPEDDTGEPAVDIIPQCVLMPRATRSHNKYGSEDVFNPVVHH